MPDDQFGSHEYGLDSSYPYAHAVIPSDSVDLPHITRALWIGANMNPAMGVDISVEMAGGRPPPGAGAGTLHLEGQQTVVFKGFSVGTLIRVRVHRVNATGTDATDIVALW